MTVKIGISLPDDVHAQAKAFADSDGDTFSRFIDNALRNEIARRELADHALMINDATDTAALQRRAKDRQAALRQWKDATE